MAGISLNYIVAPVNQVCIIYSDFYHSNGVTPFLELILGIEACQMYENSYCG